MAINDFASDTNSAQYFPQASMPDSTFETIRTSTTQDDTYLDEEHDQSQMDNNIIGALKECLEGNRYQSEIIVQKIVSNEYVEMPLGRLAREAIGDAGAKDFLGKIVSKVISKMKTQGDVDVIVGKRDISFDDELNQKLERFKVKTVNIGGVVKEDNK